MINFHLRMPLVCLALVFCATSNAETGLSAPQRDALRAIARRAPFDWPEITPAQADAIYQKAAAYQDLLERHHMPQGMAVDVWWNDYERSSIRRLSGLADSALWTGHYLAALACQYRATGESAVRGRIFDVLDAFDDLSRVSGRVGYMPRYAGLADDPAYHATYVQFYGADPKRPGFGRRAHRGEGKYADWVWLGGSSPDTYSGVVFGLAAAWAYVDDAEVRERVRLLAECIADRLLADGFRIMDGKGSAWRCGRTLRMAVRRLCLSVNPVKYASFEASYVRDCRWLPNSWFLLHGRWDFQYYANNLSYARVFSMYALEDAPERKALLRRTFDRMQRKTEPHLNAHFAALYLAATGCTNSLAARACVQGLLLDYPEPPKFRHWVDHRGDPDHLYLHGRFARFALLPSERVPSDFLWQRSPCILYGNSDIPFEYPGIDVFLPYWMGRMAGVIPAPERN